MEGNCNVPSFWREFLGANLRISEVFLIFFFANFDDFYLHFIQNYLITLHNSSGFSYTC